MGIGMKFCNKHYERIDVNGYVIKAFSDAFEQPIEGDICVNEQGDRHYNPILFDNKGCHLYIYVDDIRRETTEEERQAELSTFPAPQKTEIELLNEDNLLLMMASAEVYEQMYNENNSLMLALTEMYEELQIMKGVQTL